MGEFLDTLKLAASAVRNMQQVNRLNDEADTIVKRMTGLPPAAFTSEFRSAIFERVKSHYLNNFGPPYDAKEVAAFKLLCYSRQDLPHPFDKRVEQALKAMARELDPLRCREELLELAAYI